MRYPPSRFGYQRWGLRSTLGWFRCNGVIYWAEFKGSWQGKIPGLRRTDTVKKALANAFLVATAPDEYPPVIILTSHLPVAGSSGDRMLEAAAAAGAVAGVFNINDPDDVARLLAFIATDHYP